MATTKKAPAKKTATRKYSPAASKSVETEVKAMKKGELKSGSGKKVTDIKQAIAIGLSEARKDGKKVPEKKS
jgi:anti-sigma28 factor (negative regulator of flagellin synthesis)